LKQPPEIFAIDLGTSKFCIARVNPTAFQSPGTTACVPVVDSLAVPAKGTKRGMITDFSKAQTCLVDLVAEAESRWNCDIIQAVVGIAGSHLRSHLAKGSIPLRLDEPVSIASIRKLEDQMIAAFSTGSSATHRDLLDAIATSWQLDQRDPVDDPIGFSGSSLSADFLMIDADKSYLKDVVRLVNAAGIRVNRLVSEPLASAHVCAGQEFRALGCCVVDIGGGTSDGLVFVNGKPAMAFSVPMAGFAMTSDLAVTLNIPHREAERIKTIYGLSAHSAGAISVEDVHGNHKSVPGELVARIIDARSKELTTSIAKNLVAFKGKLGGGLLLTGGGSQLQGLPELMASSIRIPVKAVHPRFNDPAPGSNQSTRLAPKFATVLGLLVVSAESGPPRTSDTVRSEGGETEGTSGSLISKLKDWIRDMS
jgi:cell division protein FtsA